MPQILSPTNYRSYLTKIKLPAAGSHKGQNGKLLIIGGSELFHAASRWSLDVASRLVDMVFYSSAPINNQLILQAKSEFWDGIVIPRTEIEAYLQEADCVLIGPGMERLEITSTKPPYSKPTDREWETDTAKIVNYLLAKYPQKKWVIDAGALQMMDPHLLNQNMIITPHRRELKTVLKNFEVYSSSNVDSDQSKLDEIDIPKKLTRLSQKLGNALILLKGPVDNIATNQKLVAIKGGNAGLTKGGTGDVLAGLVAGLYTTSDRLSSAVVGSYINKLTGEKLYQTAGSFYNASELAAAIPQVLWDEIKQIGTDKKTAEK